MEKTKKQKSINKVLTLMLAFVMVFTGMGIGSWGVSEAWADDDILSNIEIRVQGESEQLDIKKIDSKLDIEVYIVEVKAGTNEIIVKGFDDESIIVNKTYNKVPEWYDLDCLAKKNCVDPESMGYSSWDDLLADNGYDDKNAWLEDNGFDMSAPPFYGDPDFKEFSNENYDKEKSEYHCDIKLGNECSANDFRYKYTSLIYDDSAEYYSIGIKKFVEKEEFDGDEGHNLTKEMARILVKVGGKQEITVDREQLEASIANAEKLGSDDVYQSDDRFNGKEYLSKGSFWSIMNEKLANAKATNSRGNAAQSDVDAAKNELNAAIANLIPKTQLNATALYEAIEERGNYPDDFLEGLTAPSLKAYKETLKEARAYLASLFDEKGEATEINSAKNQDKANELANKLMKFSFVWQESVSEAKENLKMLQALAKRYAMTENNGKYTEESWNTFVSARKAAVDYAEEHPASESMRDAEIKEYSRLTREFLSAVYGLTSAEDTIKVTFTFTDDFHLRGTEVGKTEVIHTSDWSGNKVQKQQVEFNSGETLADLWTKTRCNPTNLRGGNYRITSTFCSVWYTFVNGTMLYGYTPGLGKDPLSDDNYVLKDGDEIQLVHMDWPSYTVNYIYREGVSWDKMADVLGMMQISGKQSVNSGEAIDLTVKRTSAHPWTYTGSYSAYKGATLAAYGPQLADGSYPEVPILSDGVSKEDGSVSLKLYKSGKYIITAYDARKNDEDKSLFYSGTVAAPYLEVEVKDADDTGAVKAELKAELDKVYKAYAKEYFRPENWAKIQTAYDEAVTTLNHKDSTASEAYDVQNAAIKTIQEIQETTTAENTRVLSSFRENLNKLPDDESLITKSVESVVTALINTYNGMSKYQQTQLTQIEKAKYERIKNLKLDALPEEKEYKLNLKVTADTAAAETAINHLIQELRTNPPKMDRAEGGKYDHTKAINIVTPFTFGTYSGETMLFKETFEQAAPLTDVRIYTGIDYAAYFQTRNNNGSFSAANGGWKVTDENFAIVLMAPTKGQTSGFYSTSGHLTITIGDTAYELKSVTYEGLDKDAVTRGTQRVYDDSGYKGKSDDPVNMDIPDAYLGFAMPYNDVTITLNWGPVTSAAELQTAKDNATRVLQETFAGYEKEKESYSQENWTTLEKAYQDGLKAAEAASTIDGVTAARKAALTAMAKVTKQGSTTPSTDSVGMVYVTVENTTFTKGKWEGKTYWDGQLVNNMPIEITQKSTMMSCVVEALEKVGATQVGAEANYISEITDKQGHSLAEFDGGPSSGWMGTLNDWFTNLGFGEFTVANGALGDGDEIRIMYTTNGLGEDLGGSWANSNTTLKDLAVSGGTLSPSFASGTSGGSYDYTLLISGKTANVKITPTASNKNFLTKIFLNEKVTNNTQGASFYKRTQYIPVTAGDTIYVGCGERQWASMNNQEGNVQTNGGTWYVLKVISGDNAKEHIENAIKALPAADKVKLSNYKTVDASVKEIESLLKALSGADQNKIDQTKLKAVKEKVKFYTEIDDAKAKLNALTDSSSSSQARAALDAYNKLSEEQKKYITQADVKKFNELAEKYSLSGISGAAEMPESEVETTGKTGSATTTSPTEVKMSGTTATVTVKAENQKEILKQAKEKKSAEVILTVAEADSKGAEKYELSLDKSFIQSLIKDTTAKLVVKTPIGQKTYDREALQKLADEATTAVIKAEINKDNLDQQVEEPTVDVKALTAKLTPVARSAKTAKKNVKVTVSMDKQDKEILSQLTEAGYTVKYRFFRSTKKASGYKSTVTKKTMAYTNTSGKKGTKYFYKVQVRVYDEKGKLAATTALKQCKYACRTWSK